MNGYAIGLLKNERALLWGGIVLVALALLALPFALASVGTTWVRITNLAILFVLLALGLNIVVGFAGLLDLGYVAFYAVGAYVYALLASPHFDIHWPFWVILPIGAAVAALFGVLLGVPTLKLRGDYLAIVTLGFGEIVRIFLNNLSRPVNITNGPQGIARIDPFTLGGLDFSRTETYLGLVFSGPIKYYYLLLLVLLAVIFVNVRLQNCASAGRGRRCARTRSQPAQWASTRGTSSCSLSRWVPRSAELRAACFRRSRASSRRRALSSSSPSWCSRWSFWAAWAISGA